VDLAEVPIGLILAGLTAYVVLGGADFGAGVWYMALPGERRRPLRDHTFHAMGPVWEANHVWLIFVLVIAWTVYPRPFAQITSTLYAPLFIAAIGIILRGTMYALRGWATRTREERLVGVIFGTSSVLTPFALGAAVGGIASDRVPATGAPGDAVTSWLNPTSVAIGVLAVATSAYLAATWLTADAARHDDEDLVSAFRARALGSGIVAGGLAVVGFVVIESDAPDLFDGLTSGAGLVAAIASGIAGAATLAFIYLRRLEPARYGAAVAVGAVVTGWALAQRPDVLPGLTAQEAAAGDSVIVAVLVSTAVGLLILVPSLALLFSLVLRGRFDETPEEPGSMYGAATGDHAAPIGGPTAPSRPLAGAAGVAAGVGVPMMLIADGGVVLAAGVVLLIAGVALGCAAALPVATAGEP
jgi:cytochrome d ubiquinol oxidase subunit II